MWYFICLIIGGLIGVTCMALCYIAKDADKHLETNDVEMYFNRPLAEIELCNFKETLRLVIQSDISLYEKLYSKSNNTYYLGRIKECEFLLRFVEGKKKNEKCKYR